MIVLRHNTPSQEVPIGKYLDSTDGDTEETALTIASTDIKLWKTGATTLANKNSGGGTHISNGIYYAVFDATDSNTLGSMKAYIHVSGALANEISLLVLPQKIYDAIIAETDSIEVDMVQVLGAAVNLATAQFGANVVNWKGSAAAAMTGDAYSILNNGTHGNSALKTLLDAIIGYIDTEIAAIKTQTDKLGYTGAGPYYVNAQVKGQDNIDFGAAQKASLNGATPAVTVSDKTGFRLSAAGVDDVWDEAIADHLAGGTTGAALNGAGSAGDPWTASLPGAYGAGTAGKIIGDNINATISSRSTLTAQQVWEYATRTLSSVGTLVSDVAAAVWGAASRTLSAFGFNVNLDAAYDAAKTAAPASTALSNAVWTNTKAGYLDAAVSSAGGGTAPTVEEIDTRLSATHGAGMWGGAGGSGATEWTYTLTRSDNGAPIADASVWVTSDQVGANVLASGLTDQNGQATFYLDPGTVYVWAQKSGFNFSNPNEEVVS